MRDWSEEWKSARLTLQLRDGELYQGEHVTVLLHAVVSLPALAARQTGGAYGDGDDDDDDDSSAVTTALEALETRWRRHCDGARVQLKVAEVAPRRGSKPTSARVTLFHQESQLSMLPLEKDCGRAANDRTHHDQDSTAPHQRTAIDVDNATVRVSFRVECTLRVRACFSHRPLSLILRVTPQFAREAETTTTSGRDTVSTLPFASELSDALTPQLLTAAWTERHVFSMLREETRDPPVLTRRVECAVSVAKPLRLQMETRPAAVRGGRENDGRMAILAKAINTHDSKALQLLDLQLHLNQFTHLASVRVRDPASRFRTEGMGSGNSSSFRIIKGGDDEFPLVLHPHEQYNFVFIVEEVDPDQDQDQGQGQGQGQGQDQGRSGGHTSPGKSASSGLRDHAFDSEACQGSGDSDSVVPSQQSLLTVTWEHAHPCGNAATRFPALRAITEHHTIIWSPSRPSAAITEDVADLLPAMSSAALLGASRWPCPSPSPSLKNVRCVRRGQDCPLSVTLVALQPEQSVRVGHVATLCVQISNQDHANAFDLTLVLPHASVSADEHRQSHHSPTPSATPTPPPSQPWIAFEAAHHLGRLEPHMMVRKSLRVVFLRVGRCDFNALLLFDHASSTWFLPARPPPMPDRTRSSDRSKGGNATALAATTTTTTANANANTNNAHSQGISWINEGSSGAWDVVVRN